MKTTQSKNKKPHVHSGASQHTFKLTNRWVATNNSSSQAGNTQVAGLCENSGKLPQLFAQLPARTSPSSPMRNPTQLFFYWERPSHQHPDTHIPEVQFFFCQARFPIGSSCSQLLPYFRPLAVHRMAPTPGWKMEPDKTPPDSWLLGQTLGAQFCAAGGEMRLDGPRRTPGGGGNGDESGSEAE